jgi:putative Ca2+/H+ antiporter (TMEM165/GDT1 family)
MRSSFTNKTIFIKFLVFFLFCTRANSNIFFLSAEEEIHNTTKIHEAISNTNMTNITDSQIYKDLISNMTQHFIKESEVYFDFWTSMVQSIISILTSEIADKTFILILYFSSKCDRSFVLFSSIISLLLMNFFSIGIGYLIDILLYKRFIDWIVSISIFVLGFNILRESCEMSGKTLEDNYISHIRKTEKHNIKKVFRKSNTELKINNYQITQDQRNDGLQLYKEEELAQPFIEMDYAVRDENLSSNKLFWMIFSTLAAAECGDKSQFTTVMISAVFDIYGVIIGTSFALITCISLNVYYGHQLAKFIREKQISIICGIVLMLYSVEIFLKKFKYI